MASNITDEKLASVFLWRIENLSYFDPAHHGREITSPSFACLNLPGMSFNLKLFPRGGNERDSSLVLHLYITNHYYSTLHFEWSFLDADGSPLVTGLLMEGLQDGYSLYVLPSCPTQKEVFMTRKSSFLPHDTLTIRFRILDPKRDFPQVEHISAVSRIQITEDSFIWSIEELSDLQLGEEVNANVLLINNLKIVEDVLLKFSLTGASLNDASVKVEIVFKNLRHQYRLKVFISDREQNAMKCLEASYKAFSDIKEHIWVLPNFLSRQEILEGSSMWLRGDALILLCKVTATLTKIHNGIEKSYLGPEYPKIGFPKKNLSVEESESKEVIGTKPNRMKQSSTFAESNSPTLPQSSNNPDNDQRRTLAILAEDLMSMYQEHILSDFELRSGDVSFPVHKAVLSARSPVFKAMFSGNMQEADSDFLVVPDVDPHTLGRMLTFLYAGTVDTLQGEDAAKLYYAADKYQVQSLKQECSSILKSNISVSNVSDVLEFADRHQDQGLTSFVHDFILNHFDEVMFSDEWNKYMDRNILAGKTSMKIYKMKHEMKHQQDLLDGKMVN